MRLISRPVSTFDIEKCTKKRVQTLRGVPHVIVRLPCAQVLLIMLSGRIERRQRGRQLLIFGVRLNRRDRKSVVWGKSVSVRLELGGGRMITTKTQKIKV